MTRPTAEEHARVVGELEQARKEANSLRSTNADLAKHGHETRELLERERETIVFLLDQCGQRYRCSCGVDIVRIRNVRQIELVLSTEGRSHQCRGQR